MLARRLAPSLARPSTGSFSPRAVEPRAKAPALVAEDVFWWGAICWLAGTGIGLWLVSVL
jgi:hypothetical protein